MSCLWYKSNQNSLITVWACSKTLCYVNSEISRNFSSAWRDSKLWKRECYITWCRIAYFSCWLLKKLSLITKKGTLGLEAIKKHTDLYFVEVFSILLGEKDKHFRKLSLTLCKVSKPTLFFSDPAFRKLFMFSIFISCKMLHHFHR
jgi:hypothetical protein